MAETKLSEKAIVPTITQNKYQKFPLGTQNIFQVGISVLYLANRLIAKEIARITRGTIKYLRRSRFSGLYIFLLFSHENFGPKISKIKAKLLPVIFRPKLTLVFLYFRFSPQCIVNNANCGILAQYCLNVKAPTLWAHKGQRTNDKGQLRFVVSTFINGFDNFDI